MTQEEVVLDGKTYVSSKRAAKLTNYAQDYIGQICRKGSADCRRINGLWYVTLDSLEQHKNTALEVKSRAFKDIPQTTRSQPNETVLAFSGEEYISSKHGAEVTGYNPDYITQLARGGKVRARQIGNRWYVARKDLVDNKDKNDALLAAVQAEAAGMKSIDEKSNDLNKKTISEVPISKYTTEVSVPLMPRLADRPISSAPINSISMPSSPYTMVSIQKTSQEPAKLEISEPKKPIESAFVETYSPVPSITTPGPRDRSIVMRSEPRRSRVNLKVASTLLLIVVVIGGGFGSYITLKNGHISVSRIKESGMGVSKVSQDTGSSSGLAGSVLLLITQVMHYERRP